MSKRNLVTNHHAMSLLELLPGQRWTEVGVMLTHERDDVPRKGLGQPVIAGPATLSGN
jgi:hypothetical protein